MPPDANLNEMHQANNDIGQAIRYYLLVAINLTKMHGSNVNSILQLVPQSYFAIKMILSTI